MCLVVLSLVGWACSQPTVEPPPFEVPSEVVPDWINPTDMEALFPNTDGCFVAVGDGVRILQVFEGTKAHGALRAGDIITSVDGTPTNSREALLAILQGRKPGESLRIAGIRTGNPFSTDVELTPVPEDPDSGLIGVFPETRLRVVKPSDLPTTGSDDAVGHPVVLDGSVLGHSPLAATWVPYPEAVGARAVALGSELYAVAASATPALVNLVDGAVVPVDPGPVLFDNGAGPTEVFVSGFETPLTSVGELVLVAGTVSEGEFSSSAIHAVDPVEGTVAWTRPLGLSRSGLSLVATEGYRSPSGDRAIVALVEEDQATDDRSAVLTYYLLDEQGEGEIGPPGIDRFIPTSGLAGWYDDDALAYVAQLDATGVAIWDLNSGDHTFLWPIPPEVAPDLVTVIPVGDGRHLVQVRSNDVSLIDVFQPVPVRPIARGCSFVPMDVGSGGLLPQMAPVKDAEQIDDVNEFVLTILHSSAGESRLLPDEGSVPGAARFITLLKQLKVGALGDGVITLGSGDNIRASPELGVSLDREGPLYDSVALSGVYDAMALGGRDFDFGPDVAARMIEGFTPRIPFLAANLDGSQEPALQSLVDRGLIARSAVIETGGERIGVIGVVTPLLPEISSPRNAKTSRVFPAVLAEVAELEELGINKIILVSHLQHVIEEVQFARSLAGVDVIVSGGANYLLRNEGDTCLGGAEPIASYPIWLEDGSGSQVPLVAAPGWYRCIGELNVTFDTDGHVLAADGRSVGVGFDVAPDPEIQTEVVVPLATELGLLEAEAIGMSEVELDGRLSTLRMATTNAGNLLADAVLNSARRRAEAFGSLPPDVAIQHAAAVGNNTLIPAGEITTSTTWGIAPFDIFLAIGEVPRDVFRVLLEQALDRLPEAGDHFPQISGFTVVYDPDAPAREIARDRDCSLVGDTGTRVREVVLDDGTVIVRNGEVVPGVPVVVATLDFLAFGGECYPLADLRFTNLGVTHQQALADYISRDLGGVVTDSAYPLGDGARIVPTPGSARGPGR